MSLSRSPKRILYSILLAVFGFSLCGITFHFEGFSPWFPGALILWSALALLALLDFRLGSKASLVWFLCAPFFTFYCVEALTHDPWKMAFFPQLINALFYYLVFLLLLMITSKSKWAIFLSVLLFFFPGIINYYTMEFRDSPILPWDIQSIGTALSITDNYQFAVDWRLLYLLFFFTAIAVIGEKTDITIKRPRIRLSLSLGSILLGVFLYISLQFSVVTDNLLTFSNLFTQWATYRDNGLVVSFITNMRYMNVEKPEGYDDAIEALSSQILEEYSTEGALEQDSELPNIIVIMNEAFSDLSVIHDFSVSEDYMPNFRSLMERPDTISGHLYVSVVGGNTANTEFEFLTGDSMAFLPSGSVAYQQYIKDVTPSYASLVSSLDYTSIALHPYYASGWDRDEVYPWLGFETSLFRGNFTNKKIIRSYISDETTYDKIISLYENHSSEGPLFFFDVTMQNHGGYTKIYDNFPIQVTIEEETATEAAENYLSLVLESDRAFKELIDYFSQAEEDTIILMFGDHQPSDYVANTVTALTGKSTEEMTLAQQQNRYIVPFVIWANFDMENSGKKYERLSANYLSGVLSQAAGLPLSPYQSWLLELSETLPVITGNVVADQDGNFYPISQPGPYEELLYQYSALQYNHLFDTKGRILQLFSAN